MRTETRNEAADRLRKHVLRSWARREHPVEQAKIMADSLLAEALAAERRATVERIRTLIAGRDGIAYNTRRFLTNLLDAEAS